MAYAAPTITSAGLIIPSYNDILTYLVTGFQNIYGPNVYLGNDSADYQLLSIYALALFDCMNSLQLVYNNRGPGTAIGAALDGIIKLNGLVRKPATNSTCTVTITGTSGTVITNGVVQDVNGYYWSLPSPTTLTGTTTNVIVTCQTSGVITANAGTLTTVATPTAGWSSVTNAAAATAGTSVEADSTLRARQAVSVALPSSTRLAGTYAGVDAVDGVTRLNVLENPTGSVDPYGNPPHSITVVVEGGLDASIAQAIYDNKGIGPDVNGTNPASGATLVTVVVTDPTNGNLSQSINFFRPQYIQENCSVFLQPLTGYTSAVASNIQTAVAAQVNSFAIGQALIYSEIYGTIVNVQPNPNTPQFSIKAMYIGSGDSSIANVSIASGGTGYVVGDALIITGGSDSAQLNVISVGAGGVVTAVNPAYLAQLGTGYTVASGVATTGGTGTGCTINILTVGPSSSYNADIPATFYDAWQMVNATADVNVVVLH